MISLHLAGEQLYNSGPLDQHCGQGEDLGGRVGDTLEVDLLGAV